MEHLDRFVDKIWFAEIEHGSPYMRDDSWCWVWTAHLHNEGYGQFRLDGRKQWAHRVSYETFVGPIPDGLHIDHLCRVRACVNPDHLEAVTHSENVKRGEGGKHCADKTHCPQGHPYEGDNLYVNPRGKRECRECHRERERRRRAENPDAGPQNADKTHCPQGHPYEGENLIIGRDGRRRCRECVRERDARYRAKKANR